MKTLIILMSLALISCQKTINAPEKRISAASNSNAIIFDSLVTLDYDGFIANECAGELIHLTGKIHINLKLMLNSNILTETYLINFMDVKGIGEVTGAEYVAA